MTNGFRRRWIAVLAILGAALGTGLMTTLLSLSNGMNAKLNETMDKVAGDVTVTSQSASIIGGLVGGGTPLPAAYVEDLKTINHVLVAAPIVTTMIPKEYLKTLSPIGTPVRGVDPSIDASTDGALAHIIQGRGLEQPFDVLIGKPLLSQLQREGAAVDIGSTIEAPMIPSASARGELGSPTGPGTAPTSSAGIPALGTKALRIVGIFETGNEINDRALVGSIEDIRELAGLTSQQVTMIRVKADSADNVNAIAEDIERRFASAEMPVQTSIARDLLGDINKTLDTFRNFLLVISAVAAVAGGISILIIMLMNIIERRQEFGILKAGGWSNRNIIASVFIESIALSTSGAIIGCSFGALIGRIVDAQLGEKIALITAPLVIEVIVFGVIMGIVGGLYPALRAARVSPMETLKSL